MFCVWDTEGEMNTTNNIKTNCLKTIYIIQGVKQSCDETLDIDMVIFNISLTFGQKCLYA